MVVTFLGSLVQSCCREGGTLQTNITGVCGECLQFRSHSGFASAHSVCVFPVYTVQALGCFARNCLRQALGFRSGSGSWALHKTQTWLGLRFVPFPGPSSSGDQVLGERGHCGLSPPPSLPLGFLGVQPVHLLRGAVCLFWELISGCDPPSGC